MIYRNLRRGLERRRSRIDSHGADQAFFGDIDEMRKEALERSDAGLFYILSETIGLDGEEARDLYEEGRRIVDSEDDGDFDSREISNGRDAEYWERVSRVALRRFSELQRGERIGVREIKRRLGEIRKTGYDVKPYGSMNHKDAWNYLMRIRRDVAQNAQVHCQGPYRTIEEGNREQARAARDELR